MRGAIARRKARIALLETTLADTKRTKQHEIDECHNQLAQKIAHHKALYPAPSETMSDDERHAHNIVAEHLRSVVNGHTRRIAFLNDDPKADDTETKRSIRLKQEMLVEARRALAEHISHSVTQQRLLDEFRSKPEAHIAMLEAALASTTTRQQREITIQRQKMAEAQRDLAEHISGTVKQERLIRSLEKEIAAQVARVAEFEANGFPNKKAAAERQLGLLDRELKALIKDNENRASGAASDASAPTKTITPKAKESKRDRLARAAEEAKAKADKAATEARKALEANAPLAGHLTKKAAQLKQAAEQASEKFDLEDKRSKPKAVGKDTTKPKPKPKAERKASTPAPKAEPKPAAKVQTQPAVGSVAKPKSDTPIKPAVKKFRYTKILKPARPAKPIRTATPETELPVTPNDAAVAHTPAVPTAAISLPHEDHMPVPSNRNQLAQQVLAILNNDAAATSPNTKFADREIAKRQAAAAEQAATAEALKQRRAAEEAAAKEAQLEETRLQVLASQRAAREAAAASDSPTLPKQAAKKVAADRIIPATSPQPQANESSDLTKQLGLEGIARVIDPLQAMLERQRAARRAAAAEGGSESLKQWEEQEAERQAETARHKSLRR